MKYVGWVTNLNIMSNSNVLQNSKRGVFLGIVLILLHELVHRLFGTIWFR